MQSIQLKKNEQIIQQLEAKFDQYEEGFYFASSDNRTVLYAFEATQSWHNWPTDFDSAELIVGGQAFQNFTGNDTVMSSFWFAPRIWAEFKAETISLHVPEEFDWQEWLSNVSTTVEKSANSIVAVDDESDWIKRVEVLIQKLNHDQNLDKVVFGRQRQIVLSKPLESSSLWQPLSAYTSNYRIVLKNKQRYFVSVTPERLLKVDLTGKLYTASLAGTAPRGEDEAEDAKLGSELMHSRKNRLEQDYVTRTIRKALGPYVKDLTVPFVPKLLKNRRVQHLYSPITAQLLEGQNPLKVLQKLHPTPALGGIPRQEALDYISENECYPRGLFAGPIGYLKSDQAGEFAVGIRSMMVADNRVRLFAGAGILAASQAEAEYAETQVKLEEMGKILEEALQND
ncbi:isochorismate synthase [Eupransor demetentiae]|uniref:isochorismate synthase n=1 Tax=Eupransor demetentiae TaxID=3109584 RepID=A0ABM9N3W8_9LACO|nr:Isochorismate synthase EntC (MenF) [Lactobacillaceae bacterium LMG 33000]